MRRTKFFIGAVLMAAMAVACGPDNKPEPTPDPEEEQKQPEEEEPQAPPTVNLTEIVNLTPTFIGSITGPEENEFEIGSTATIKLIPGEILTSGFGTAHMEHIHVHVADTVYIPTFPEGAEGNVQDLSIDIKVPEKNFDVTVAYAVQQKFSESGHTLSLEENNDGIKLYGVSPEKKYQYFDCYLLTPDAYTIKTVEFKVGSGEWTDVNSVTGCKVARTESIDRVYNLTIRPDYKNVEDDITVRVTGEQHGRYKITWINTDYIRTDIPEGYQPNYLPEESIDGEEIVASFYTKAGYYLNGASADVEGVNPECMYRAYVRFTMPASDVNITLDFKDMIPVEYEKSDHIADAKIYDDNDIYYGVPTDIAIPGEYIYLFVNPENGYKPSKAYNDKGEAFDFVSYGGGMDSYKYYAAVQIPADATSAKVRAEAVKAYKVSGQAGVIYINGGAEFAPGETVTFQVAVPSGKTIKEVIAAQEDGTKVECNLDNTNGSFIMPAANVNVTAEFKDVDAGTIAHISAIYDEYEYSVYSQTQPYYQRITEEGFDVPAGTTLYISINNDYGEPFWVGVKIGDSVSYYEASIDPDWGEASFGKSFTFTADAVIKVGATKSSVEFQESNQVTVKAIYDPDEFIIKSYTNFNWKFAEGFKVDKGTSFNVNVQNMYGESFWVGIKNGSEVATYQATEDEETGEYTFSKSITANGDVTIKAGYSKSSVEF